MTAPVEIRKKLRIGFAEARVRLAEALVREGFGVSEIDVAAATRGSQDVPFEHYVVVEAIDPRAAYRAVRAEPGVSALFPCQIALFERVDGHAEMAAEDPVHAVAPFGNPVLNDLARDLHEKLWRVFERLPGLPDGIHLGTRLQA